MNTNKKIIKALIALSILLIISVIYNRGSLILNSEIVSAQITSCKLIRVYDDETEHTTTHYVPVVESEFGKVAEGGVLMPNRATCSQQIGQHVSALFNERNFEDHRIFTFIQFWALPSFLLVIPLAFLIGIYSPIFTKGFVFLYILGALLAVYFETGYLEKHFPVFVTGKKLSQSESALSRCIDTSMRNEFTTKRSQIKKLICQDENITELTSLTDLNSLESLYLQGNSLVSLESIPSMPNLKILSIAGNKQLTSTKGIEKLTALQELQANKAGLINLIGIEQLSNLRIVGLMMNKLTSVSKFKNLVHLENVGISYNPISDISAFKNKTSLIEFSAHGTKINDISPLLTSINLQIVGVSSSNFQCAQLIPLKEILINTAKVYGPSHWE